METLNDDPNDLTIADPEAPDGTGRRSMTPEEYATSLSVRPREPRKTQAEERAAHAARVKEEQENPSAPPALAAQGVLDTLQRVVAQHQVALDDLAGFSSNNLAAMVDRLSIVERIMKTAAGESGELADEATEQMSTLVTSVEAVEKLHTELVEQLDGPRLSDKFDSIDRRLDAHETEALPDFEKRLEALEKKVKKLK